MGDYVLSPDVIRFLGRAATPTTAILHYEDCLPLRIILSHLPQHITGCSLDDVIQWTNAFFSILDAPEDLRGILHAEPVLRYWIPLLIKEEETSLKDMVLAILHKVFEDLRQYAEIELDKGVFDWRPHMESAPLFAFHVGAFHATGKNATPCQLYEMWGRKLHEGLREVQKTTSEIETLRGYTTSARLFFVHFPHSQIRIEPSSLITPDFFKEHLEHFCNGYIAAPHRRGLIRALPLIAKDHCQRLWRLFHKLKVSHRLYSDVTPSSEETSTLIDDSPTSTLASQNLGAEILPIRTVAISSPLDADVTPSADVADGRKEDPDETVIELISSTEEHPLLRRPPHLPRNYVSRYILHQYEFWWDSKCLSLEAIVDLYKTVEELRPLDISKFGALILALLTPLFSGRDARDLEEALIAHYPTSSETEAGLSQANLFLDIDKAWFFFHQSKLRSSFQQPEASGWLASTAWVPFPIPKPLLNLWRAYLRWLNDVGHSNPGSHVLQYVDKTGQIRPLKGEEVPDLLKEAGLDASRIPRLFDISRGFRGWLVHAFGLNDVSANFISGQLTRVGPKPRYTHLVISHFHVEYQQCCKGLHDLVRSFLPSSGWWSDCVDVADHRQDLDGIYGVGSPLVLGESLLGDEIQSIGNEITRTSSPQRPEEIVAHHNAYVTYAALALGILGVRPRNDLGLSCAAFIADVDYIPIVDKLSALYIEDRLLGLPPTVKHLLHQLATGRMRLMRILEMYFGRPAAKATSSDALLVSLRDDGSLTALNLSRQRDHLASFGSDHLGQAPLNVGRHYNRSTKVPVCAEDIIDCHIGHQRAGREPFCSFGSAFIGQALNLLTDQHEEMVARLRFKRLLYFPNTK